MDRVIAQPDSLRSIQDLLAALVQTARMYWRVARPYQRLAYLVGGLLLASSVFHAGVLIVSGGSLHGPVSWRKPILFGEAFGLTSISVAWILSLLPDRPWIGWPLMLGLSAANAYEVAWVSLQQWRGVPSHFNYATAFDERLFALGGVFIAIGATVILLVTLWSFIELHAPASLAWAIRMGLILLLASQFLGFLIIENGNSMMFDRSTGEFIPERVAQAAVFGQAGSMKVPHALTLHALQLLPGLALLLQFTRWREPRRLRATLAAALGYTVLVGFSVWQTFSGRAFLDVEVVRGAVLGAGMVILIGVAGLALSALRQSLARQAPPA